MSVSSEDEVALLIFRPGIPAPAPDIRKPYEKQLALYILLASIVCERIAYFVLDSNLALALPSNLTLNWTDSNSSTALYIFEGVEFISMVIFAIISDAKWGRAKTIIIGFPLYLIGYMLLTLIMKNPSPVCSSNEGLVENSTSIFEEQCAPLVLSTLVLTAIGAAAVRSCLILFGADQIQKSPATSRYFDQCVVAWHLGIIFQLMILIIADQTKEDEFFTMFVIASSALFISAILFFLGWRYYLHVKVFESVSKNFFPVMINAVQNWWKSKKKESRHYQRSNRHRYKINHAWQFSHASSDDDRQEIEDRSLTLLDYARMSHNGKFHNRIVNDVISLRNALITFFLLFPYRIIMSQLYSILTVQGQQMRAPDVPEINAMINSTSSFTVILGVIILNVFVYKSLQARNRSLTIATKFVIGMCFALFTMCITAGIEYLRQYDCPENTTNSELPIYAQIPQNISIGFAQLFGMLACFEFAYFVAPRSAQSLFMTLYFCSIGVASYISASFVFLFEKFQLHMDFSCATLSDYEWHYITYFFIFAGLQLIFLVIFIICQKKIQMVRLNPQQCESRRFLRYSVSEGID